MNIFIEKNSMESYRSQLSSTSKFVAPTESQALRANNHYQRIKYREQFENSFIKMIRYTKKLLNHKNQVNTDRIAHFDAIVQQCYFKYNNLMEQLMHDQVNNHLPSYNPQLHQNSTAMKQNLINFLKNSEQQIKNLNIMLIDEQKRSQQTQQLSRKYADDLKQKEQDLRSAIIEKRDAINAIDELQADLQSAKDEISDQQLQIQDLKKQKQGLFKKAQKLQGMLSQNRGSSIRKCQLANRSRPKSTVKISGLDNSRSYFDDNQKSQKHISQQIQDENLLRILLLQATCIEEEIIGEKNSYF